MRFVTRSDIRPRFEGKTVAIVGSGPGVLENDKGFIDSHDVVVRINNFKIIPPATGARTDVFYSFFGRSIKKEKYELKRSGVTLCMCKCPNDHAIDSDWHVRNRQMIGVDYRPHYERRKDWWFCDTYIPTKQEFLASFELLGRHVPTTGFACILDVLLLGPRSVYLTGFDFYRSGIHNVNERWRPRNSTDPIGHVPEVELAWLRKHKDSYPLMFDARLSGLLQMRAA